jgi:hypothetical protein
LPGRQTVFILSPGNFMISLSISPRNDPPGFPTFQAGLDIAGSELAPPAMENGAASRGTAPAAAGCRIWERRLSWKPAAIRGFLLFLCFFPGFPALAGAAPGRGPLRVSNYYPPHLMFLMPAPAAPRDGEAGNWELDLAVGYAASFVNENSKRWRTVIDLEMTVLEFGLAAGLSNRFSLGADLRFAGMSGGFLDGFLEDFHDAFGLPNYGRDQRPDNEFLYYIEKDGEQWLESEFGGMHPVDSSLSAEYLLTDRGDPRAPGGRFTAALSYALKLPVGDETAGFGSGKLDHRVALPLRWIGDPFALYLAPAFSVLADPDTAGADIRVRNVFGTFFAAEWAFGRNWSALAGLNFYTSPFENTGIDQFDDDSFQLDVGLIWSPDPGPRLELSFSEDLTRPAPDFALRMGLGYRF